MDVYTLVDTWAVSVFGYCGESYHEHEWESSICIPVSTSLMYIQKWTFWFILEFYFLLF